MSNLFVFTTGDNLGLLRESAKSVMITLHEFPNEWTNHTDVKLRKALVYLSQEMAFRNEQFVMWVDGHDSLLLKPEKDILARYLAFGGDCVLMSAESTCWPDAELADKYPKAPEPRYLNTGGFIGHKNQVMAAMATVIMDAQTGDDQREWTRAYLTKQIKIQLDHTRRIFSNLGDGKGAYLADSCVKHWNGSTPGREEYWNEVKHR